MLRRLRAGLVELVGTTWDVGGCILSGVQANESNFRSMDVRIVRKNVAITAGGNISAPISIKGLCAAISSSSINWKLVQKKSEA